MEHLMILNNKIKYVIYVIKIYKYNNLLEYRVLM